MEPPPTGAPVPQPRSAAPPTEYVPKRETLRRTSDGGIPHSRTIDGSIAISRARILSPSTQPTAPIATSFTPGSPVSSLAPSVHGTLRNKGRASDAGVSPPSINLSSVKDTRLAGVSPGRVMKAPASPSKLSVVYDLKKVEKGEGIIRTISSRTTEAWDKLDEKILLEKYGNLASYERIIVASILKDDKFNLVKEKFLHACKKHLPKLSGDERKQLLDVYIRKGVESRIKLVIESIQLTSFKEDLDREETLRRSTLAAVKETSDTQRIKGFAQMYVASKVPLDKVLNTIVAEQKEGINPSLLRFGVYLLESLEPERTIDYGHILLEFLGRNSDNPQKPAILVELNSELNSILEKRLRTYLAGQLIKELCFRTHDETAHSPNELSNTEKLIFDIAYGYFRVSDLDELLSVLAMSYIHVTEDPHKRILMLKLMTELLRITPPQKLNEMTTLNILDAIDSASQNKNEEIMRVGLELKFAFETFNNEYLRGILNNRDPRLLRMPSKSNIQELKLVQAPTSFMTDTVKWETICETIVTGQNTASIINRMAFDLKNEITDQLRKITVKELVDRKWEKESIPSMKTHIDFTESISLFVREAILSQESLTQRSRMLEFFIELMSLSTHIHDYASGYVLYSALDHTNIERLHKTWDKLSATTHDKWNKLCSLYNPSWNHLKPLIRTTEASCTVPLILVRCEVTMNAQKFPILNKGNVNLGGVCHLADTLYLFLKCFKSKPEMKNGTDLKQKIRECRATDASLTELSKKRESGKKQNLKEKIGSAITKRP